MPGDGRPVEALDEVDPNHELPIEERERRAEMARKVHSFSMETRMTGPMSMPPTIMYRRSVEA